MHMIKITDNSGYIYYIPESKVDAIRPFNMEHSKSRPYSIRVYSKALGDTVQSFETEEERDSKLQELIAKIDCYNGLAQERPAAPPVIVPYNRKLTEVDTLGLPRVLLRRLHASHITTIDELLKLKWKQILNYRNVGQTTLKAAVKAVHENGFKFVDPHTDSLAE